MVAFKSTLSALAVLALSGGVLADHWVRCRIARRRHVRALTRSP
jgi:hypothetical protein